MIAPQIHHSRVKPASLKWECIPDPASPCRITLQNLGTLPWQDSTSQDATGDQEQSDNSPALVTSQKLTSLCTAEAWGVNSPTGQTGYVFHPSYFTVMHCHPLSVSAAVVLTLVFAIGLAEATPADWYHGKRVFICSLLSLLSRMHNYCLLLPIGFNSRLNTQPPSQRESCS
jgi:hypothetical protein